MDRLDRAPLATFFAEGTLEVGASLDLSEDAARHARARRVATGDEVRLTNGAGRLAIAHLADARRAQLRVEVRKISDVRQPPQLSLFVPVADRDRMLWLAEKCAEIGVSRWQPIRFRRSSSVSPRGEGDAFRRKLRSRMVSALEQSGGAWLPDVECERSLEEVLARNVSSDRRYLLNVTGTPLIAEQPRGSADVMLGPEGGLESDELAMIVERHGWLSVSLGATTLRFETAGVLAAGMVRAQLALGDVAM